MNLIVWIVQGLLGVAFVGAGAMKLATPHAKLAGNPQMGWVKDFSGTQVKLIGLAELLGGIGLVLPWALQILPVLTPIAAAALVVIMLGAVQTHLRRKEPAVPAIVLGLLSAFVALARFGVI